MLTDQERERYTRQLMIPSLGIEGQEKLKKANVFLAGAGGLGSPAAIYLAAAGIGTLRIVDYDTIELGNLNRQILHWDQDIGRHKVDSAKEKLNYLNPHVNIEAINEKINESNIAQLISGYSAIVDATDNLPIRYLLNKTALEMNIPLFHGAVYGFEGRAMTILPGKSACLMCLYRGAMVQEKTPVIGVTPAVISGIQVTEVIKYITGTGKLLTNRLLIYDGLNMKFVEITLKKDPTCQHCCRIVNED